MRSGKLKKVLFLSPVVSPLSSSAVFSTPTSALGEVVSTPLRSVREQKEEQAARQRNAAMAESVAALEQCLESTKGKVDRIRQAIVAADHDYGKFNIHALKLYVRTVDAANDEYSGFLNRIYLVDPTMRNQFEPRYIDFEELYHFVRISLSEMIQQYEDDQKDAAEVAIAETLKQEKANSNSQAGSSGQAPPVQIVPSLLLQQAPLPTFDGSYEHWYKFRDRFTDIVNKCTNDSPATKLHFLDKALVGKAKGAIDQQTLNDNNYQGAWKILAKKFENLRMVVQVHITQLLSLKPMVKGNHAELTGLLDTVEKRLESLEFHNLKMTDKLSEALIVTLVITKLDAETRRAWEATVEHGKLPEYRKTMDFLREYCYMLERCEQPVGPPKSKNSTQTPRASAASSKVHTATVPSTNTCLLCNGDHLIGLCETFKGLSVNNRYSKAKQLGLCFACLKRGHRTANCKLDSSKLCECKKKHHPLMHFELKKESSEVATGNAETRKVAEGSGASIGEPQTVAKCEIQREPTTLVKQVLLATAEVDVLDSSGVAHKCRALLDSGAMASFVSERMCDLLSLRKRYVNVPVVGVTGAKTTVKFKATAMVKSRTTDYSFSLDCLVVPRVTGALPSLKVDAAGWPIPRDLKLADPKFCDPSRVDMLVGAEKFYELLQSRKIRLAGDLPQLQESLLGWLVAGPVYNTQNVVSVQVNQAIPTNEAETRLEELMKRFWTIEEQTSVTLANDDCERHFQATYTRGNDGRYIVQLPFREDAGQLGDSRAQAEQRFKALEKRLDKSPELKQMYSRFIHEYLELGHATVLKEGEKDAKDAYYLPHHCVLKPESSSTKLRVVFDASAKTTTNLSLNDVLMEAPIVQSALFDIVLRWRLPRYVFSGDVRQMYRQVLVHPEHTKYSRCLFRDDKTQQIQDLELQRVTYGVGPAGFLATRSLIQLAKDEEQNFPDASEVVLKSFYVDDALTGADTLEKALKLRMDMQELLRRGGFKLHKWCANDPGILEGVPLEDREKQLNFEDSEVNGVIKTLGLLWDPASDCFVFRVKPTVACSEPPTKRQVLSEIARLFDPLGVLGPVIVLAKIIMQRLWRKKIDWDETIPSEELEMWSKLRSELCELNNMRVPRRVTVDNPSVFELHGFSDASRAAYGCCVYLRSVTIEGIVEVKLLCGKSRVTPLKELNREEKEGSPEEDLTIPRLELCAAVLLANQIKTVRETLGIDLSRVVLRSDSKIVICWIKRPKPNLPVFVRNRIAEIRKITADTEWFHVGTTENPADLVSRGVLPTELLKSDLWWNGPDFLRSSVDESTDEIVDMNEPPVAFEAMTVVTASYDSLYTAIQNSSNFRRLQRVFGYVTRFVRNCRAKKNKEEPRRGNLTVADHRDSLYAMVRIVQHAVYREEISCILKGENVRGKLRNLHPIFDEKEKLLRVGGRIRNSVLPHDQKHPLILPEKNRFTDSVIEAIHREELHVGQNGLLARVRQQFWPVNAKRTIKRIVWRCVKCFKLKPRDVQQFMGDLPVARVTAAQPFVRTGVDYAGPFHLKQGRLRAPVKAYVCVFVCMTTKAIHFELVSSLSAEGFLGALHRFTGRRGNVSEMFSDNGTNFIGGERQLTELRDLLKSQLLENKIEEFCQPRGISWKFIPPKAPHQGGLWEAGVKSMKTHLRKTMNESYLTYEEMTTLLIQIEAILNSRPLFEQSNDPTDYEALSPAHFLIGREMTAIAEPLYDGLKENALSRYQLVQKRKQSFWKRWSSEYITGLQGRGKWYKTPTLLREGLLVILKEDGLPPQTWHLGRIIKVHPGDDGVVRVVTVRTSSGTYKRATTKIAVLPVDEGEQDPAMKG